LTGPDSLRHTPFHDAHVNAGAKMVSFAGWHLPVQFSGLIHEHLAVRTRAGLFDVSHMGEAAVRGQQSLDLLQRVTCNDVGSLSPGRVQYNALTTPEGTFVDDLLVYRLAEERFLLVVNAANTAKDLSWLRSHAEEFDVEVEDESDRWAQLAIQGPNAAEALQPVVARSLNEVKYYRFIQVDVDSLPCVVSRTGYTGEPGFEIYAPAGRAARLWDVLLDTGAAHGLVPVGLGARDTLRLEAKLALYGNDIDETTTVVEADLGWIVKPQKGEFLGRDVLTRQLEEGASRKLVGFEMLGRRIARHGYPAAVDGRTVGRVASGSYSPTLEKNIGLAYLPTELCEPRSEFQVEIRGRIEPAVVVPTPFYRRPKRRHSAANE
jgi:aminomethyltransferase